MSRRYYSAEPLDDKARTVLTGPEAHHLQHVLHARLGSKVTLFDGKGAEFDAVVIQLERSRATLAIGERHAKSRELRHSLHVAAAPPKTDRQRWLVEKSVELGVASLTPLITDHSETPAAQAASKWSRYVIEASKQCGRNCLMTIGAPTAWRQWLATPSEREPLAGRYVAHPGGFPLSTLADRPAESAFLAVGPEGGFTLAEIEAAQSADWQIIDLGPRILRIETAVAALATLGGLRG